MNDCLAKLIEAQAVIAKLQEECALYRKALEPFAQLSGLGKEDKLTDYTVLRTHLFNAFPHEDIEFHRHQQPYQPLLLGHIREAKRVMALGAGGFAAYLQAYQLMYDALVEYAESVNWTSEVSYTIDLRDDREKEVRADIDLKIVWDGEMGPAQEGKFLAEEAFKQIDQIFGAAEEGKSVQSP